MAALNACISLSLSLSLSLFIFFFFLFSGEEEEEEEEEGRRKKEEGGYCIWWKVLGWLRTWLPARGYIQPGTVQVQVQVQDRQTLVQEILYEILRNITDKTSCVIIFSKSIVVLLLLVSLL
jgi:hypothetical protein